MKNKTKRVFWGFFSLDYKAVEIYLEEMAKKGWMLEKVGRMTAKFRAIEPQKLKFYVDVFKGEGPLTPERTEEAEEYRRLCQESGWTFITSQDYLQFFYAEEGKEAVPIQTDEVLEQSIVETTLWRNELLSILAFFIVAVMVLARYFPIKYNNLLSFTGVAGTLLFPLLCLFMVASTIYYLFWMLRARRNIKRGFPLEKPTLEGAIRRKTALHGPVWLIGAIFILAFAVDAYFAPRVVGIALLGPAIGAGIGLGLRYFIKKKATRKEDSVMYVVISLVVALLAITTISSLFINRHANNPYKQDAIPEGYPVVTMAELLDGLQQGRLVGREFNPGISPIIPRHYKYWETRNINGRTKGIHIYYYSAIGPYFADIVFNGVTERLERGIKWRGQYLLTKTIIPDDEMKRLWNVDNLALTKERDEIIVQKGNTVVHVSGDIDFDDKRTMELITSRFF